MRPGESGVGVLFGFGNISGLCIDLGGGSTEISWVVNGRIKVEVAHVLPLSEARTALELSQGGHTRGKIVLKVE